MMGKERNLTSVRYVFKKLLLEALQDPKRINKRGRRKKVHILEGKEHWNNSQRRRGISREKRILWKLQMDL